MGSLLSRPVVAFISSHIPNLILNMMRPLLNRSVAIEISNNTQNITLRNPRTYMDCGYCSVPPKPELSPGSGDSCQFLGSYPLWGVAGVLVYEAESFTLAIYFSNPIDYNRFPMELGLELSPGRACEDSLEDIYERMASGAYSRSHLDIKFDRGVVVGRNHGTAQLSDGPVKVTATMSSATDSCLKVVLEEPGGSEEEAGTQDSCRRRPYREKLELAGPSGEP